LVWEISSLEHTVLIAWTPEQTAALRLAIAALVGLSVGFERERAGRASGPDARFAGLRTFLLLGALGGTAGVLLSNALVVAGAALLAAGGAFVVAGYVVAVRKPGSDIDGATEGAALVVLALGAMAGLGYLALVGGATAIVVLALMEKTRLHALAHRVGDAEMRAALQFAVLALVVLPLLPDGPYGPLGGIKPRELWIVVLIFSALSFVGYLARKAVGPSRGYAVTGLLGGVISSTAVTLQFSRQSRREPAMSTSLAIGSIGACTVLLPRVAVLSAILNAPVALALIPFLLPPLVVGIAIVGIALWRSRAREKATEEADSGNPLRLWSAIQMAVAFQAVLMGVAFVRERWGARGVLTSAAILGLTDMDALTLAMNRLGSTPDAAHLAAEAIAIGILANTLLKLTIGLTFGTPAFRKAIAGGLIALGAASGVGLWLAR
jgi:uncharacterized membrane protein (DUF4010 family)